MINSIQIPSHVQKGIDLVEQNMLAQVDNYNPSLQSEVRLLISAGGKRIRPIIILLINSLLGGTYDQVVNLATAIELLHTATLVHDDLIDGSSIRRGIATLNSKWPAAVTVLTGDFLFACASTVAARCGNLEVIELFSQTLAAIVKGEIAQMFTSKCNPSREDYIKRIYAKTASLFETSGKTSAILSGADKEKINLLARYGYSVGMAFQIVDDVLDYTGEQTKFGKPIGSDLRQGLITLPMHYYIDEHSSDVAVRKLVEGNCFDNKSDIDLLIKAVSESNAIQKSIDEARVFMEEAKRFLDPFDSCLEKDLLLDLASFTIARTA